jgi:SpoVK/Ycf46/Vps4 family AAA+-type ATPase
LIAAAYGPGALSARGNLRAIAEDFDLPVYVFDLATLHNDELRENWTSMLSKMPCIALIEDIDSIFDGRKTLQGHLTFDCLLNCLDGVERSDGLLTFITTNNPEKLDPAIGGGDPNSMTTRPGRIDHVVRTGPLCKEGRIFLASRILQDAPEQLVHKVVSAGDGDTGAQFELRCVKAASSLIWGAGLSTVT